VVSEICFSLFVSTKQILKKSFFVVWSYSVQIRMWKNPKFCLAFSFLTKIYNCLKDRNFFIYWVIYDFFVFICQKTSVETTSEAKIGQESKLRGKNVCDVICECFLVGGSERLTIRWKSSEAEATEVAIWWSESKQWPNERKGPHFYDCHRISNNYVLTKYVTKSMLKKTGDRQV